MICFIYKWMISYYITEQRELPLYLKRHIGRCGGCRSYYDENIALIDLLKSQSPFDVNNVQVSKQHRQAGRFAVLCKAAAFIIAAAGVVMIYNYQKTPRFSPEQIRYFDQAADMLFDSAALKQAAVTGKAKSAKLTEHYENIPQLFRDALGIFVGNLSVEMNEDYDNRHNHLN